MLSLLHIENIAVISSADIVFDGGFNVLTGETGAGKSIVIDAIGAIMGERTSRDLIRTGAKSARVSAVFRDLPELNWFKEYDIHPDENGELLVLNDRKHITVCIDIISEEMYKKPQETINELEEFLGRTLKGVWY